MGSSSLHGACVLVLLPVLSVAQNQQVSPVPRDQPVQHRGTYHLATGTWSPPGAQTYFGPDVLYRNDAALNYYYPMEDSVQHVTDEGRLPGLSSTMPAGLADDYTINGFEFSYCSLQVTNPLAARFIFYDAYSPCTEPSPATAAGSALISGLPIGGCWILLIDLENTTLEFTMEADGADGVFDDDPALDSFGWEVAFLGHGNDPATGPLIAGNPNLAPFGDGTVFQNPGAGVGTGLGQQDLFWVGGAPTAIAPGCYFFGGPPVWAGFHLVLHGLPGGTSEPPHNFGMRYGNLYPNSVGPGAEVYIDNPYQFPGGDGMLNPPGPTSDATFTLQAGIVPFQPGIFFFGTTDIVPGMPFGCGERLVGGSVVRLGVVFPVDGYARDDVSIRTLPGFGGMGPIDYFFQYWYRDPAGMVFPCNATFNLSRAVATVWR